METLEFFQPKNITGENVNLFRDIIQMSYRRNILGDEVEQIEEMYLNLLLRTQNIGGFKFFLHKGLNSNIGRRDYPSSADDANHIMNRVVEKTPESEVKFDRLLVKLLKRRELPPIDPEDKSDNKTHEQYQYRDYFSQLLRLTASRPRSEALFDAGFKLLKSRDARIHGVDTIQDSRFTDFLLYSLLTNHQTDRRMQPTWEAALRQKPCKSRRNCFYPELINISYNQAFTTIISMPGLNGETAPLDIIIPSIKTLLESNQNDKEHDESLLTFSFINLFEHMSRRDRKKTKKIIDENFTDNALVLSLTKKYAQPRKRSS